MNLFFYARFLAGVFSILLLADFTVAGDYYKRDDVRSYIDQMVETHGFDRIYLEQKLKGVVKQERAIAAMDRPAEAKPWPEYEAIFITPSRINGGVLFWKKPRLSLVCRHH